jgi:hypothetical protein
VTDIGGVLEWGIQWSEDAFYVFWKKRTAVQGCQFISYIDRKRQSFFSPLRKRKRAVDYSALEIFFPVAQAALKSKGVLTGSYYSPLGGLWEDVGQGREREKEAELEVQERGGGRLRRMGPWKGSPLEERAAPGDP